MEKRLTRSDYVFILAFIFMLICALGAFFYGMKLGTERTEAKYTAILQQQEDQSKGLTAYDQSYLVSFYHTVYLPFREFNLKWAASLEDIENQGGSADASSLMKELNRLSEENYEAILTQTMPDTSPLLQDSHQSYLKSLKLFSQATRSFQSKANNYAANVLISEIGKDAYFTEAINFALRAQENYYESIVKWQESLEKEVKGVQLLTNHELSFEDWNQMNLNVKNLYIAGIMARTKEFRAYTPQDVSLRIDELIRDGQAKKMNATSIMQITDILAGAKAVRQGDFIRGKTKMYANEILPQLPFFTSMD